MSSQPIFKKSTCHRHGLTTFVCLLDPRVNACAECVRQGFFHASVALPAKAILSRFPDPDSFVFYAGLDSSMELAN